MPNLVITREDVGINSGGAYFAIQVGHQVFQGEVGYEGTDGKYYKAEAGDTEAKAETGVLFLTPALTDGWAVAAGDGTEIVIGATLTPGIMYVTSTTPGNIFELGDLGAGDWITTLGIAKNATTLQFRPNPTGVQK